MAKINTLISLLTSRHKLCATISPTSITVCFYESIIFKIKFKTLSLNYFKVTWPDLASLA